MARRNSMRRANTEAQRRRVAATRFARKFRLDVFIRDDFACVYCGDRGRPRRLDHRIPVSKGGTSFPSNLCCACDLCDKMKGDMTARQFERLPRSPRPIKGKSRP